MPYHTVDGIAHSHDALFEAYACHSEVPNGRDLFHMCPATWAACNAFDHDDDARRGVSRNVGRQRLDMTKRRGLLVR